MLPRFTAVLLLLGCLGISSFAIAATPSPEGAEVYFISPTNGAITSSPVTVVFGLKGMGVAPAGVDRANTGHHHLLIDLESPPAADKPIPADAQHRHFGGGQTEAQVKLSPGEHTLQLIMGDKNHVPLDPVVVSEKITIIVK
jgi:hypothetical protein